MATIIKIDPDILEGQAKILDGLIQDHDRVYSKIKTLINNLETDWEGMANTEFMQSFRNNQKTFDKFAVDADSFRQRMVTAATVMRNADYNLREKMTYKDLVDNRHKPPSSGTGTGNGTGSDTGNGGGTPFNGEPDRINFRQINTGPADLNSDFYFTGKYNHDETGKQLDDKSSVWDTDTDKDMIKDYGLNMLSFREFMDTGRMNCTFYCYGRMMEKTGRELKGLSGHGVSWYANATNLGYTTSNDITAIKPNSVASFDSKDGYGHVVFIEDTYIVNGVQWVVYSECNVIRAEDDGIWKRKPYDDFIAEKGGKSAFKGYIY